MCKTNMSLLIEERAKLKKELKSIEKEKMEFKRKKEFKGKEFLNRLSDLNKKMEEKKNKIKKIKEEVNASYGEK